MIVTVSTLPSTIYFCESRYSGCTVIDVDILDYTTGK